MRGKIVTSLELKVPPLFVTLIFALFIWALPVPCKMFNATIVYGASSALFIVGSVFSLLGVWEFRKQKTTVNPMTPQESNNLVIKGVYKITRNPMYLGFLLWLLSLVLLLENLLALFPIVGFVFYMNRFQIIPEERILNDKFGQAYCEYKRNVRRWI